ncbi:hypothetical protein BC829DRAFT_415109 [Chytridium lagenaria]|nr:hypothetical protein BC829DRAFT_415109 [Chytridium lagenaria]
MHAASVPWLMINLTQDALLDWSPAAQHVLDHLGWHQNCYSINELSGFGDCDSDGRYRRLSWAERAMVSLHIEAVKVGSLGDALSLSTIDGCGHWSNLLTGLIASCNRNIGILLPPYQYPYQFQIVQMTTIGQLIIGAMHHCSMTHYGSITPIIG